MYDPKVCGEGGEGMKRGRGSFGILLQAVLLAMVSLVMVCQADAYSISGTISNTSGRSGRTFISLQGNNGGYDTGIGVSVPAGTTSYQIRGVTNGDYKVKAFVDGTGTGMLHANDATFTSGTVTVNNADRTGVAIAFTSAPTIDPSQPPVPAPPLAAMIMPGNNGVFVVWDEPQDNDERKIADAYRVYYSTDGSDPRKGGLGTYVTVPASDNAFALFHYANGTTLKVQVTFIVRGVENTTVMSTIASQIIGPPPGGVSISGTITPAGFTPNGSLYVAIVDRNEDGGPVAVAYVGPAAAGANTFTISGVPDGTYAIFPLIDMDDNHFMNSGDVIIGDQAAPFVDVTGTDISGQAIPLAKVNANPFVNTVHNQDSQNNDYYSVIVGARSMTDAPVNVTITSGPVLSNGYSYPLDLGIGSNNGGGYETWLSVVNRPVPVTDVYSLHIQYALDGTEDVNVPVATVLDALATLNSPASIEPLPIPDPVLFSWTNPASMPNQATISFWVNNPDFWNIQDNYWNLPSSTTSVSLGSSDGITFNEGERYDWTVTVRDAAGNQAQKSGSVTYTSNPTITTFFPTSGVPGTVLTINGANFDPTPANNTIVFNGMSGPISVAALTASTTQLTVVVPSGATGGQISVRVGAKTGFSNGWLNILWTINVSGKVTNSAGDNISGATVTMTSALLTLSNSSTGDTSTNNYSLNGVPASTDFILSASKSGYDTVWSGTVNAYSDVSRDLTLYAAGTVTGWNSGDANKGAIRGKVADLITGNALASAVVTAPGYTVLYDNGSGPVAGAATGSNGIFYILGLADGTTVSMSATASSYQFSPLAATTHAGAVTTVTFEGAPLITVSGTVTDSTNTPLDGVLVEEVGTPAVNGISTDGAFSVNNLPGGTYFELKLSKTAFAPVYTGSLQNSASFALAAPYILFTPTELASDLHLTAGQGGIIGRIVNSADPAVNISGATVYTNSSTHPDGYTIRYYDSVSGQFSLTQTATDASGMFLVMNVEDGMNVSMTPSLGGFSLNTAMVTAHADAVTELMIFGNMPPIGFGALTWPATLTTVTNQATQNVYGQVYVSGVTYSPGPAAGLVAELGYGPVGSDPSNPASGWTWKTATYNTEQGGIHEFMANLNVATVGSYDYGFRYAFFGGPYVYGDFDGSGNGWSSAQAGKLTVSLPAATTISASTSSGHTATYGDYITLQASIAPTTGLPEPPVNGSVQFKLNSVDFGTPVSVNSGLAQSSPSRLPAGNYFVTAVYSGDSAYGGSSSSSYLLTVNKAQLTVTANPQQKVQGAADPLLTYGYSGFVSGDAPIFNGGLNRVAGETPGTYAIGLGDLSAGANYSIYFTAELLTITPANSHLQVDFDGDDKTDIAIWREAEGNWYITNSGNSSQRVVNYGAPGDSIIPGDYDGDGKTDIAVFRPGDGNWFIINSADGSQQVVNYGTSGDIPVPGNYDSDNKSDIAVYRPTDGNWYITNSSDGSQRVVNYGGVAGDKPIAGDYDGDGKTDIAIFRATDGNWYVMNSADGSQRVVNYGTNGDIPVPGNYDSDNKTDIAVYRPGDGNWYIMNSSDGSQRVVTYGGVAGDIPVSGDYDGDGKTDIAIYRPTDGNWYIMNSSDGSQRMVNYGESSDKPVK